MQHNCIITKIDICDEDEEKSVDQILEELDAFVGMDNIKKQVRELANKIQIERTPQGRAGANGRDIG